MIFLLDVNLLIALCDVRHVYHELAHDWFKKSPAWATCPLTQNAFIRISSKPLLSNAAPFAAQQLNLLRQFCSLPTHSFWADSLSLLEPEIWQNYQSLSPAHITNLYLLALAVKNKGRLASFDRRIPAHLVRGGKEALLILS